MILHCRVFEWLKRSGIRSCSDVAEGLTLSLGAASDSLRRLDLYGVLVRHGKGRGTRWSVVPGMKPPPDRRGGMNKGQPREVREPAVRRVAVVRPELPPKEWADERIEHHWGTGIALSFADIAPRIHLWDASDAGVPARPQETQQAD